jgi:hypothetical protein
MESIRLSDLNERLFELDRMVSAFTAECQSGLVREETYQTAIASVRAITDVHKHSYLIPKYAVGRLLNLAHYLRDDAPPREPRGQRMIEMSREVWQLIGDVLTGGSPPVPPEQDPTFIPDFE